MTLTYPENTVWYIEARPWSGDRNNPGFAPVKAAARGSGVVVTFIRTTTTAEGEEQREVRSYLLTCAHVVRDREDLLLEDIICYPPGKGFVGTAENTRRSGEGVAKARAAVVSKYSPCQGDRGRRPEHLRNDPASDWVLLKVDHPSFRNQPSVEELHENELSEDQLFEVVGFPGGALIWEDGDIVKATVAKDFRPRVHPQPGMIDYEGPEETRPGMSGGGIFDETGVLVGIHRSNTDSVMKKGGIRAEAIAQYLTNAYQLDFKSKPKSVSMKVVWEINWHTINEPRGSMGSSAAPEEGGGSWTNREQFLSMLNALDFSSDNELERKQEQLDRLVRESEENPRGDQYYNMRYTMEIRTLEFELKRAIRNKAVSYGMSVDND
ncbi:Trypsin-like peptidase domain-containing protein [Candidatus Electrothrix aarhusensis]|uniref:Trypsin-like peptidase domain-containing protein n=1 Tax=Candidatus Electrothrix aarhusensis TaxID=1859131 RepID=A0A3S3SHT9_9BACT|nr:Trypsin-like peptidase domain-containing protein [Candidatus Electrothrix aarhusensis]